MKKLLHIIKIFFCINFFGYTLSAEEPNKSDENFFGVTIYPALFSKTSISETTKTNLTSQNINYNFGLGINYFFHLAKEKYFLMFGLFFETKKIELQGSIMEKEIDEIHNMKYFSLSPLGIFLKTDDIGILDLFLVVTVGIDVKLLIDDGGQLKSAKNFLVTELNRFGLEGKFFFGVEYTIGDTTSIFGGIICILDIVNCVNNLSVSNSLVKLRAHRFGISMGINF